MSRRSGPAIDAGSSLARRESQSASKHPRRITTTVCPSNLNVGRRFYDRWMTWNHRVSVGRRVGKAKRAHHLSEFVGVNPHDDEPERIYRCQPQIPPDLHGQSGCGCRAPVRRAGCCDAVPAWCGRRRAASRRVPAHYLRPWARLPLTPPRVPFSPACDRFSPRSGPGRIAFPGRAASAKARPARDRGRGTRRHDNRPASAAPPDIRSPMQSAAAIALFRPIKGLLKSKPKCEN